MDQVSEQIDSTNNKNNSYDQMRKMIVNLGSNKCDNYNNSWLVPDDTVQKDATEFPYLGWTVAYNNSYWLKLYSNQRKSHRRWGVVAKLMGKMGAPIKYQAIIVLLYGSETWVVMNTMMVVDRRI